MSKNLIIPVIYLPNNYQAQHIFLDVPKSQVDANVQSEEKLSDEDVEFLKSMNMTDISYDPQVQTVMPGFLSDEMLREVDKVLESQPDLINTSVLADDEKEKAEHQNKLILDNFHKEKRTKLYCIFQTQPQLFKALNDYLPEEYRLPVEIDFLGQNIVNIPVYEDGNVKQQEKQMQLAPCYYKEYPEDIRQDAFECLSTKNIFGNAQEQQDLYDYLNFKSGESSLQSYNMHRKVKSSTAIITGRGNVPMQFNFLQEDDRRDLEDFQMLHSSFADKFKEKIKKKFLELINIQYKQHHAKELAEILQSLDQKTQKPTEIILETAVSMLYFDKLDIIYAFQLMQQTNNQQLKNQRFGWPTQYPVKNPEATVQAILTQTERRYQEQKSKTTQLQELYKNVFQPSKTQFDQGGTKDKAWQPKMMEKNKIFQQEGVSFYELKIIDVQFTGTITIPKQLYDEGIQDKSPLHKQLIDQILTQIQNIKIQKQVLKQQQQQLLLQKKKDEEEPEQFIVQTKKWKKSSQKRFVIKVRPEEKILTEMFIRAGKMNTMTVFDLDHFHQLMIGLCGEDLEYPPFYFEDMQSKTSFGSQISLIKAPRQIYSVLFRFNFAGFEYLKKGQRLYTLITQHRFPFCIQGSALDGYIDVFKKIDGDENVSPVKEQGKTNDLILPNFHLSSEVFDRILNDTIKFGDVLQECVDKSNFNCIHPEDEKLLKCGPQCNHCVCDYLNKQCYGKCEQCKLSMNVDEDKRLKKEVADRILKYGLCPLVYDYVNDQLRPGYILLSSQDLFRDDEEDPQSFTYVTKHKQLSFSAQSSKNKGDQELDECFWQFESYSQPNSFKRMNYASMILQFVELYFNSRPDMIRNQTKQYIDDGFSDYFSSRLDALMLPKEYVVQPTECYKEIKQQLQKANQSAKNVITKFFERLQQPYDRFSPASDIIRNAFKSFSFRVLPSNFFCVKAISSFYNDQMLTNTDLIVLNHNLRSPDVIVEMLNEPNVTKDDFTYPMTRKDIEVDMAALKKDQVLQKLQTFQKSYKVMPDDMYQLHKVQHDDLFDKGIYEQNPFHNPNTFQETRQLANSVLNRGKYFTIPFGSEATRQADIFEEQDELQSELTTILEKQRANQSIIKSQYIKWSGPTGAEAQVCHIEEEQLCYGLFRQRANCLMKILISWITVYMPSLLKFFDCCLTTTAMDACPDLSQAYLYRNKKENELQARPNNYFFNGEYQTALEQEEEEHDEENNFLYCFSKDFDIAIHNIAEIYQSYSSIASSDEILQQCKVQNIQDFWQKNCYAPIQQWPFGADQFSSLPPPPHIPALLQYFITQIYGTGDILDEMYKNPIVTIPIIARTLQHQVALCKHAEQRSAAVWRVLYPDAYYRSIDHATVFLNNADKKLMQPKQLLHDLQRRIQDYEQANNPNLSVDSQIDFCLPRIFDIVSFKQYFYQLQQQGLIGEFTIKMKTNYWDRLIVTQQMFPMSKLTIPFKFNAPAATQCLLTLADDQSITMEEKEIGSNSFKKLISNIFSADDEQYDQETAKQVLDKIPHDSLYDQILQIYPNINLSLILPSDVLQQFIRNSRTELLNGKYKEEEQQQQQNHLLFIEDLMYDIINSDKLESDYSQSIYRETTSNQLSEMLRSLKFDNSDAPKFIKTKLESAIQQNKVLPSLFVEIDGKQVQKESTQFHSRYRQLSMPCVSDRAIYLIRSCVLGEKLTPDTLLKLTKNEFTSQELKQFFDNKINTQKIQILEQFIKNSAVSKSQAQQLLPQLQMEIAKKQIFDEVIIPILQNTDHNIRYFDNELYILSRLICIASYRLEYCIKIIESLTDQLRQAAVYGTRSIQPIALSFQNQGNMGCSLFGNNLVQILEEQQQRPVSKTMQDSIPLAVSQRIFNGHQPYAALINTADVSINNCICGCITCPFCGGIGAGLNGTLSGSMNSRVAYSQMAELEFQLANGYQQTTEQTEFTFEQIVMHDARQMKQADLLEQINTFVLQNNQISLIYKLKPVIPKMDNETHLSFFSVSTADKKRTTPNKSHENSKTEDDDFAPLQKLFSLQQKCQCERIFVHNLGYRLQDTTLLPPPPDVYTCQFYIEKAKENAFVRDYLLASNFTMLNDFVPKQKIDMQEMLDTDQLVFDDPVDSVLLGEKLFEDIEGFLKRDFQFTSEPLNMQKLDDDIKLLYDLLMTQQPNNPKDDYISDQVYALLGTRGYPFLSLKKLFVQIQKKIDTIVQKMSSQHFDLIQLKYYRSSKCTMQNNLTTSLIMFNSWQNLQNLNVLPIQFNGGLYQNLKDLKEPVYLVETYKGFVNLQQIQFDKKQ